MTTTTTFVVFVPSAIRLLLVLIRCSYRSTLWRRQEWNQFAQWDEALPMGDEACGCDIRVRVEFHGNPEIFGEAVCERAVASRHGLREVCLERLESGLGGCT